MSASQKRKALLILLILVIIAAVYFLFFMKPSVPEGQDPDNLEGRWIRTDHPYEMVISTVNEDGTLFASYLNPKSIRLNLQKIK